MGGFFILTKKNLIYKNICYIFVKDLREALIAQLVRAFDS